MAPYEALYGKQCRTPLCWDEVGERELVDPELVQVTNQAVQKIRERMRTTQSRQKRYANSRRRSLEFKVGDKVFLKVAPMKGVLRFGRKGKLSPRFIGPFEILERIRPVAYRLALPPSLSTVHNVFHVSVLRKYMANPTHVIEYEALEVAEDLSYEEKPLEILDRKVRTLRTRNIAFVKMWWRNQPMEKATWEREDDIKEKYPELFLARETFEDESPF
ncbi:uncharacterized protein LOC111786376 [Cucurbita pepo subsp. pepo]|uniref:uncharacterized protein LOC111786376 n=1 Tax=Cucurbita pepo subsp. pepo TaxID=3664 RepID=UPI000C9D5A79|nr:uncharacterized protein LOC111786376 [Cucurbita pepo subsp. pepo]